MSFTQAIINRILELCEKNHITPNKLSELSTVPVANIYKMCKVFGITMAEFYDTDIFNQMNFTK